MRITGKRHIKINVVRVALFWTAAMLFLSVSEVYAYYYSTCNDYSNTPIGWVGNKTTMFIHTPSFPKDSEWDKAIQSAMWHWNNVKGSGLEFSVGYSAGVPSLGNGVNEIYYTNEDFAQDDTLAMTVLMPAVCNGPICPPAVCVGCPPGSFCHCGDPCAPAVCTYRPPYPNECSWYGTWTEADVMFNWKLLFTTAKYDYRNPGGYSFEATALHELGHALGLSVGGNPHEDRVQATMNSHYPDGGPLGYYAEWDPLADDRAGVRFIYGDGGTETDIAASALKSTGGGYSAIVAPPQPLNGVSRYAVPQGTSVNIEYTISNQSISAQTFDTGFYLSPDTNIATSDILIGSTSNITRSPGTSTFTRTVTIPYGTPPDTYYIGFIVDYNNALAENNETNNAQYIPAPITTLARLVVSKSGTGSGTVTSTDAKINCGSDCEEQYPLTTPATSVTLTPAAASGSFFAGWSGGACSSTGNCSLTMNANKSETAVFTKIEVDFQGSPTSGNVQVPVNFTDKSNGSPTGWSWAFGDGLTSTQRNPSHTYSISSLGGRVVTNPDGTITKYFTVSLTVSYPGGSSFSKTKTDYIRVDGCASSPVRIKDRLINGSFNDIQSAYNAASSGEVIQAQGVDFANSLYANRDISVTLEGGYDCNYKYWMRDTSLKGITTSLGTLTVKSIDLQP